MKHTNFWKKKTKTKLHKNKQFFRVNLKQEYVQ